MMTNLIMAGILLVLAALLLAGAKYRPNGEHFFNRENSGAMRGFWCLIVVLVHIPATYQNRAQDMLGSFAYVGVTFFFLTSACGLRLAAVKRPESLKAFWRNRLPKLLVPGGAGLCLGHPAELPDGQVPRLAEQGLGGEKFGYVPARGLPGHCVFTLEGNPIFWRLCAENCPWNGDSRLFTGTEYDNLHRKPYQPDTGSSFV